MMLKKFSSLSLSVVIGGSFVQPAQAHLGHLGELAGHSHWLGLGAVVVAGAIAAAIGKIKQDADAERGEGNTPDGEPECELEPNEEVA